MLRCPLPLVVSCRVLSCHGMAALLHLLLRRCERVTNGWIHEPKLDEEQHHAVVYLDARLDSMVCRLQERWRACIMKARTWETRLAELRSSCPHAITLTRLYILSRSRFVLSLRHLVAVAEAAVGR